MIWIIMQTNRPFGSFQFIFIIMQRKRPLVFFIFLCLLTFMFSESCFIPCVWFFFFFKLMSSSINIIIYYAPFMNLILALCMQNVGPITLEWTLLEGGIQQLCTWSGTATVAPGIPWTLFLSTLSSITIINVLRLSQ